MNFLPDKRYHELIEKEVTLDCIVRASKTDYPFSTQTKLRYGIEDWHLKNKQLKQTNKKQAELIQELKNMLIRFKNTN